MNGFVTLKAMGVALTVNPMVIVLFIAIGLFGFMLWKGQRDGGKNTFDVWDLFMDTLPDPADPKQTIRRASGIKVSFQSSFLITSWVIIDREIKGTLDASLFGVYCAVWCASLIAKVVFDQKTMPEIKIKENE